MQHWDRVEAFVEVVRNGSFAGAARQLQVSNSHISRLVGQLEQQLGTQLLYRTTRQIRLTDTGTLYYDSCRQLFDGFKEAELQLNQHQGQPGDLTCVGALCTALHQGGQNRKPRDRCARRWRPPAPGTP